MLFVATQVARAAGLKAPSMSVLSFHGNSAGFKAKVSELHLKESFRDRKAIPESAWMFDEPRAYAMLLRGNAEASANFRKWVTEEVLPTIRKTGKYDAEQSTNPIAQGVMGELKTLREGMSTHVAQHIM